MDADATILEVLRDAGITAFVDMPPYPVRHMPFVLLTPVGGDHWPNAWENGVWSMQSFSSVDSRQARDTWVAAAEAITAEWMRGGRISTARAQVEKPQAVPSGIDDVHCRVGTVTASVCA